MTTPPPRRLPAMLLPLAAPLAVGLALAFGFDPVAAEERAALIHRSGGFVGSAACKECHEDRHASWEGTFHRTMTQAPSTASVRGAFDGREVPCADGAAARPWTRDGVFYMDVRATNGASKTVEVALVTGSRRYQQYFERVGRTEGFAFTRLPIAWSMVEKRWLPMTALFLEPDGTGPFAHASDWNANCVFCHTTGPEPRLLNGVDTVPRGAGSFASKVAEFGIACESCHGPGADHAAAMRDPLARRGFDRSTDSSAIVHPARLSPDRSVAVCGQCHGQRLPEPIDRATEWITTGPTYRAGDDFLAHALPIRADTTPPAGPDAELFRRRFWGDGTPRLTAYEFQGLTTSPCHLTGGLDCTACHAMHAGDPRGQLRPGREGDRACNACHEPTRYAARAHTGHAEGGSGSSCVDCHMPRIVFGVLELHRSHRIEVPDPKRDGETGRPHACTLCHVDQSLAWSAAAMTRLWGRPFAPPGSRKDGAPTEGPDGYASLLAGDPVVRAVYARALGEAPVSVADARTGDQDKTDGFVSNRARFEATRRMVLAFTLGDAYPAVRLVARRSLAALPRNETAPGRAEEFDPVGPAASRREAALRVIDAVRFDAWRRFEVVFPAGFPPPFGFGEDARPAIGALAALAALQDRAVISIGE